MLRPNRSSSPVADRAPFCPRERPTPQLARGHPQQRHALLEGLDQRHGQIGAKDRERDPPGLRFPRRRHARRSATRSASRPASERKCETSAIEGSTRTSGQQENDDPGWIIDVPPSHQGTHWIPHSPPPNLRNPTSFGPTPGRSRGKTISSSTSPEPPGFPPHRPSPMAGPTFSPRRFR